MDSKTIMFSIQKGGVAKTTTTAMMAYLLAEDGNNVLLVDFDPQANLTEMILDIESNEFVGKSVLEAIYQKDSVSYIYPVTDKIGIMPSTNFLSSYEKLVYTSKTYTNERINIPENPYFLLDNILNQLRTDYDYILIDTPPSLGSHMISALCASDYVVALFHPGRFSLSALPNFFDAAKEANKISRHDLKIAGILPTLCDTRRVDIRTYLEAITEDEDYKDLVFKHIVPFRVSNARMSTYGIVDNPEILELESIYKHIYEELKERLK